MIKKLIILLSLAVLLNGCATQSTQKQKAVCLAEVKIIENKTTKQYLLDKLGEPESISANHLIWYRPENRLEFYYILYTGKDGVTYELCLNKTKRCKGWLSVTFDKNNIVDNVSLY